MPRRSAILIVLLAALTDCAQSVAQRVQVPEYSAPPPQTFAPPAAGGATPMYGPPPAPSFDAYAAPQYAAPPASSPYAYTPAPAAPYGAPPAASPYAPDPYAAQPYGAPAYTDPNAGGWGPSPFGWESGTYGFEAADGSTVTFQKFLQEISVEHTYLYGDHSVDALEIHRLELSSTVAFPLFGKIERPLLITPGFAFNWLEGPITVPPAPPPIGADLPPRVYDAYLDLAWYPQPTPMFGAELGVRTGVWTDFDEVNSDSVRILGRGLAKVRVTPRLEVLAGVVYIDRLRYKLLPAGGIKFQPNDAWDIYLVFPNPKVRRRLPSYGSVDWKWTVAGEYGGGSWTIQRIPGPDRFDYNDIRITTGLEWENQSQVTGHFEVGVAFDRELVYASGAPSRLGLDTTFLIRGGVDF